MTVTWTSRWGPVPTWPTCESDHIGSLSGGIRNSDLPFQRTFLACCRMGGPRAQRLRTTCMQRWLWSAQKVHFRSRKSFPAICLASAGELRPHHWHISCGSSGDANRSGSRFCDLPPQQTLVATIAQPSDLTRKVRSMKRNMKRIGMRWLPSALGVAITMATTFAVPMIALAADEVVETTGTEAVVAPDNGLDRGDHAWMLTSSALCSDDDGSGISPVLLRPRTQEKRARRDDAMCVPYGLDDRNLGLVWVHALLWRRRAVYWKTVSSCS